MAAVWGSYGRLVANPIVAFVVTASIIAINVGIIIGSRMWEVPLATEINKLWIDPASEVASNNLLVSTLGSKVDASETELFTLGNADGSSMATVAGLTKWKSYVQKIYDTVIEYNGTAFTLLDICSARLGQTSYSFGCNLVNPIDYFYEGGLFHPEEASAQWVLDYRVAYFKASTDNSTIKAAKLWAWSMIADAASRGRSRAYTDWFTGECLNTKKVFCGDNTLMLNQVDSLVSNDGFPKAAKMQLAWAKAQLVLGAMLKNRTGLGNTGTCANSIPSDLQTEANSITERITFGDREFAGALSYLFGYQDNQTHSISPCATTFGGTSCGSTPNACPLSALVGLTPLNFTNPCATCVLATMWWMGEMTLVDPTVVRPASYMPPAGLMQLGAFPSKIPIWYSRDLVSQLAVGAASASCANPSALSPALSDVSPTNCVFLWKKFAEGSIAGLNNDTVTPQITARERGELLVQSGLTDPLAELTKYTLGGKTDIDKQWRDAIRSRGVTPVNSAVTRHADRPKITDLTDSGIAKVLSGFKNDLVTQNLRGAIFGSPTPAVRDIKAGKCACTPDYAGAQCTIKKDLVCECDSSLSSTCMAGLLANCQHLAPCGGYTPIVSLVAAAGPLNLNPALVAPFKNFPTEMAVAASLYANEATAKGMIAQKCQAFVPCLDSQNVATDAVLKTFAPREWDTLYNDAAYTISFLQDSQDNKTHQFKRRAQLAVAGCLAIVGGGGDCKAVIDPLESIIGFTVPTNSDFSTIQACMTPIGIDGCKDTAFSTPLSWADATLKGKMESVCPRTREKGNEGPTTSLTVYWYFHCLAEQQQVSAANFLPSYRQAVATALWPKTFGHPIKMGVCNNAPVQSVNRTQCTEIMASSFLSAVETAAPAFGGLAGALPALGASPGASARSFDQSSAATKIVLTNLALFPAFTTPLFTAALGGCSTFNATICPGTTAIISGILNSTCESTKAQNIQTSIRQDDCLLLLDNLVGAVGEKLGGVPSALKVSTNRIARSLAKYKFMATVFGACSQSGGIANGGGDCWEDADCNSKNKGFCNMTGASPFTDIKKLAGLIFSSTPEGLIATMRKNDTKSYRRMANKPIIDRYLLSVPPARRQLLSLGDQDEVTWLTTETAEDVIRQWRKAYLASVDSVRSDSTIDPDALSNDSPSDLLEEISAADPKILILGYGLMLLYASLSCTAWSTDTPTLLNGGRGLVAQAGILLVAISVASGLGVSHLLHVEWSAAATQIVPFVMLGLGVSDVFVMLRVFPSYRDGVSAEDACVEGLTLAGPSMFIVSFTNAGVFACGALTAMPVVVNFAYQAVLVVIANYFTVNMVMPALLVLDYRRQQRGKMDLLPCITVGTSARQAVQEADGDYEHNIFNKSCVPAYTKCLLSVPGKVFVIALSTAFIAAAIYGTEVAAELGLQLQDVAPAGSKLSSALQTRDESFPFYTVSIVSKRADWSKQEVQQGISVVFDNVMASTKIVDGSGTPWMKAFMAWGLAPTPDYNPYDADQICNETNSKTGGNCGLKFNCTVVTADDTVVNGLTPYYKQSEFYRCLNIWINADLTYEVLKPGLVLVQADAPRGSRALDLEITADGVFTPYSTGTVFAEGLTKNSDFVQLIYDVRAAANADTVPPTFPAGEPIDFWDQYTNLRAIINNAVGFGLLICFVSILLLLVGLANGEGSSTGKKILAVTWASALVTGVIAMSVYEIYGYMAFAGIKISAIPAISIIMSTGVAVEYTAYVSVAFVNAAGVTGNERAYHSLMLMMAPTIDGAITMLLGVVMLAASPFLFIVKYFFYPWLFIIFFGVFNGLVFLPVLFSLVGPPTINMTGKSSAVTDLGTKA